MIDFLFLSHLFYFSFIFITLIHIQLLLAQRKDVTVRSPKTKIQSPKQAMFTTVRYCRQCTLCLLQQYKWNTVNIQLPGLIIKVPYRSNCRTILAFFISFFKKLAIIERLFWQGLSARTKRVSIVERWPLCRGCLYWRLDCITFIFKSFTVQLTPDNLNPR